jgi:hypothetical protein
MEKQF